MILTFRDCELDTARFVLRRSGQPRPMEPLVFNLLLYLAQRRERVVLRQELLDALWPGKVVSESALSSCIKAARHAIGDDGDTQSCISTLHGRGYRFVAPVREVAPATTPASPPRIQSDADIDPPATGALPPRRASIAVMPFADLSPPEANCSSTAGALAYDVIARLAQLRQLFVIAQGTVFALSERRVDPREACRLLNVDYLASGTVRRDGSALTVTAELTESATGRILWTHAFNGRHIDTLNVLAEIGDQIVAAISSEIEILERNRALLKPPESLDAWEAHHRALWHMYRFNRTDNERAQHFFNQAVQLDPTFARAWAGLSFTHFQNAFQGWAPSGQETESAFNAACQGMSMDERNPAVHWAMGRALWLKQQRVQAVSALEHAVDLSPSFAHAHYTLAFVQSQAGDPVAAINAADHSRLLSPYDPLMFGMLGSRAMALVRLGRFDEAADWAVKAAARPNAHVHILGIATYCLALAGKHDDARTQAAAMQRLQPGYTVDDFLRAFRFDADGDALFRQGAARLASA